MGDDIKILLVDDQSDFRELMTFWLESKGYTVIAVPGGDEAIQAVKEQAPDIIFLDLRMPGMDGVEVLKKIRSFNKDIPVIMLSAYVNDPRTDEAMAYGISGVFCKRQSFNEGLALLETALRTHKRLKRD